MSSSDKLWRKFRIFGRSDAILLRRKQLLGLSNGLGSHTIFQEIHGSRSLVQFLAVLCVLQSKFFETLRKSRFVCFVGTSWSLNVSHSHLNLFEVSVSQCKFKVKNVSGWQKNAKYIVSPSRKVSAHLHPPTLVSGEIFFFFKHSLARHTRVAANMVNSLHCWAGSKC